MVGSPVLTFHVHQHAGNGVKASLSEVGQLFVIQDLPPSVPREPYSSSPSHVAYLTLSLHLPVAGGVH